MSTKVAGGPRVRRPNCMLDWVEDIIEEEQDEVIILAFEGEEKQR